jgi:hypothetical protein
MTGPVDFGLRVGSQAPSDIVRAPAAWVGSVGTDLRCATAPPASAEAAGAPNSAGGTAEQGARGTG